MRDLFLQVRQLLRDAGPTPSVARQVAKMALRTFWEPRDGRPVEGIRRLRALDASMGVPFGFTSGAAPLPPLRIAAACHIFHPDLSAEFVAHLGHVPGPLDVFITTDTAAKRAEIGAAFAGWSKGKVDVRVVANRGRDIGPKLTAYDDVYAAYDLVLYLHSKRSVTRKADGSVWIDGSDWRRHLFTALVGTPAIAESILEAFRRDSRLGLVMPQHWEPVRQFADWRSEFVLAKKLARRMGVSLTPGHVLDFPSGAMFWVRPAALRPILDLGLTMEDFPDEAGQVGATPAHAIERLFLFACEAAGYRWVKVAQASADDGSPVVAIRTPEDLDLYWSRFGFRLTARG